MNHVRPGFNADLFALPRTTSPPKKPKLILHFDARNTVFVADLYSRITVEHALNTYIAGVVWGSPNKGDKWKCISEIPTLHAPVPGAISMYKLIEREVVKVPEDRATLRQILGDFTQTPDGAKFRPYFDRHLKLLRWHHNIDDLLTVTGLDGTLYHYLLPSFLKLIIDLHRSKRDFCIIVRTFGRDAPHIITAIGRLAAGLHPDHPEQMEDLQIQTDIQRFKRSEDGELLYTYRDPETGHDQLLTQERDIYNHWNRGCGVIAVVDDFVHWQRNNYHYTAAKPFWFDRLHLDVHHIIFDDNIRFEDHDNILNLRELPPGEVHSKDLDPDEARSYEDIYFVQADLLESTKNDNYFIEKVALCERKLSKLTLRRQSLTAQ